MTNETKPTAIQIQPALDGTGLTYWGPNPDGSSSLFEFGPRGLTQPNMGPIAPVAKLVNDAGSCTMDTDLSSPKISREPRTMVSVAPSVLSATQPCEHTMKNFPGTVGIVAGGNMTVNVDNARGSLTMIALPEPNKNGASQENVAINVDDRGPRAVVIDQFTGIHANRQVSDTITLNTQTPPEHPVRVQDLLNTVLYADKPGLDQRSAHFRINDVPVQVNIPVGSFLSVCDFKGNIFDESPTKPGLCSRDIIGPSK